MNNKTLNFQDFAACFNSLAAPNGKCSGEGRWDDFSAWAQKTFSARRPMERTERRPRFRAPRHSELLDTGAVGSDAPLRLDVAVKLAFPCGGLTVSGLRREIK